MIKTNKPIVFNDYVRPVCLPDNSYEEPESTKVLVAGWGDTRENGPNTYPDTLKETILNVVSDKDCVAKRGTKRERLFKSQFCTLSKGTDSCQADSGGPLVETSKNLNVHLEFLNSFIYRSSKNLWYSKFVSALSSIGAKLRYK